MKLKKIKSAVFIIVLSFFLAGCSDNQNAEEVYNNKGNIKLFISKGNQRRTVWPENWVESISTYTVTLKHNGNFMDEKELEAENKETVFKDLEEGDSYAVFVTASNEKSEIIASGMQENITVTALSATRVDIILYPSLDEGDGSFSVLLSWPSDISFSISEVFAETFREEELVAGSEQSWTSFDENEEEHFFVIYEVKNLEPGSFVAMLNAKSETEDKCAFVMKTINVYSNTGTSASITLSEDDFIAGCSDSGISLSIEHDDFYGEDDMEILWENNGDSIFFTLAPGWNDCESYQWYADNKPMSGSVEKNTAVPTSSLKSGNQISVTAKCEQWTYGASLRITDEILSSISWENMEIFESEQLPGSYSDGIYEGLELNWEYTACRSDAGFFIEPGGGIMLRRGDEPSKVGTSDISDGISRAAVDVRKAYTGDAERYIQLLVNDNIIETSPPIPFGEDNADDDIYTFSVENIAVSGECSLEFRIPEDKTGNRQIVINNIRWNSY